MRSLRRRKIKWTAKLMLYVCILFEYVKMIIYMNYIWNWIILYRNAWKCLIWGIIINQIHSMWPSASPQIWLMIIINQVLFQPFLFYFAFVSFFFSPFFWHMNCIRFCRMSLLLVLGCISIVKALDYWLIFFCKPNASLQRTVI